MRHVGRALAISWESFIVGFLYYVLLTAAVLGGADLGLRWMALAYLLPAAGYLGSLLRRGFHASVAASRATSAPGLALH